jgi:hypothetical protein
MRFLVIVAFAFSLLAPVFSADLSTELANRVITWQGNVGIPGGIPARTTIYQTLTSGATQAQIQTALNNCPSGQTVYLDAGSYTITSQLTIPSNVTLRGAGPTQTTLTTTGSSESAIRFGTKVEVEFTGTVRTISSGATRGSTSLVVSSASGLAVGHLMAIDQLNESGLVTLVGAYGTLSWGTRASGARAQGQTVEVTDVTGTTVTFTPALYRDYTLTPEAVTAAAGCTYGGLEDLKTYATNSGYSMVVQMFGSKYCWVKNVEQDYADADHMQIGYGFRCEVRDSYFHDGFVHSGGSTDNQIMLHGKTSGCLIENNILARMHAGVMMNWGASGNVVGYNYALYFFDQTSTNVQMYEFNGCHGAHPSWNLFEGNIGGHFHEDSYWGSSSHGTYLRNWATADAVIFPPYTGRSAWETGSSHHASQGIRGMQIGYQQRHFNWIGNVVGSTYAASNDQRQAISDQSRPYSTTATLFSIGYGDVSDSGGGSANLSQGAWTSLLSHGNWDTFTNGQVFDETSIGISDEVIPSSLYLAEKPAWFGSLTWPAIDPASGLPSDVDAIPAGYRFLNGEEPPATGTLTLSTLNATTLIVSP